MSDRLTFARSFAKSHGADISTMRMIAGDASQRKYYRVQRQNQSVIVMDAPPDKGEDTAPFIAMASYLRAAGLSAPDVLEADPHMGFLLIEDLGDDLFARRLADGSADEKTLYTAATDVLVHLHQQAPPALAHYDARTMADLAALAFDWYALTGQDRTAFVMPMEVVLRDLDTAPRVLIQRDYHAENLLWLPDRKGVARVGLLDFQDAMLGHHAYDLVSVLQDARRDVPRQIEAQMIDHYINTAGLDRPRFLRAYHLLGLQRNLRIVGVFARLWRRDGRPSYIDLIPRVWEFVTRNLDMIEDRNLTHLVLQSLPSPTPEHLDKLRAAGG
ncbi:MAG: phosphotransferase [Pseudomonadota bacterium]